MSTAIMAEANDAPFRERIRDRSQWILPTRQDPRWLFVTIHMIYVASGHLVLEFNRAPEQIFVAVVACSLLDIVYTYAHTRLFILPLSGFISGFGLSILFTAPGNTWLMLAAAWLTITGKYLLTWQGHHLFNPTNLALVVILLFGGGQGGIAPAYQWGGELGGPDGGLRARRGHPLESEEAAPGHQLHPGLGGGGLRALGPPGGSAVDRAVRPDQRRRVLALRLLHDHGSQDLAPRGA